jgi:AcrR family transcriptional regulator
MNRLMLLRQEEDSSMAARESTELRQTQIADAALKVIAESGLGRFTAAEIAKEVGISDGGLFRHFPNKEAIVMAAIERADELLFAQLPTDKDPLMRLREFFFQRVSQLQGRAGIARILFSDQLAQAAGPAGVNKVKEIKQQSFAFIHSCLVEARKAGILREGTTLEDFILILQGTALGFAFLDSARPMESFNKSRLNRVWSLLEGLIRKGGSAHEELPRKS